MTFQDAQGSFVNQSTVLTDADVDLIRRAVSYQIHNHFGPVWHTGLRTVDNAPVPAWQVVFKDDADVAGALGYHDLVNDIPTAYVFARTSQSNGVAVSGVASHEVLEMLADPWIQNAVQVGSNTFYALEVCDAVEQSTYTVNVLQNGIEKPVAVSDFVTPDWFHKGSPGPWDYMGKLTAPLQLEPGGSYIGVWNPVVGWTQKFADGTTKAASDPDDVRYCNRTEIRAARAWE